MNIEKVREYSYFADDYFDANFSPLVDVLLNVTSMRRAASTLSSSVTIYEIENAIHDVFLSKLPIREKAFELMFRWLTNIEDNWFVMT